MNENNDRDLTPAAEPSTDAVDTPPTSEVESGDNARPQELGGRKGPEPTRYGDWEKNGRCIDF